MAAKVPICILHYFGFSQNLKKKKKKKKKNTFLEEFVNKIWLIIEQYKYINIEVIKFEKKKTKNIIPVWL